MANDLFTDVGLAGVLAQVLADVSYLAVGSGTDTPEAGDTALTTELSRVALTENTPSASGGIASVTVEAFFPTGSGNGTITEYGILDAAASGDLYVRGQPASPVTKTSVKQLRVTVVLKAQNA